MESGTERKRYTLNHPPALKFEDVLTFVEHPSFTQDWKDLGLDEEDMAELQLCVMAKSAESEHRDIGGLIIIKVRPESRTYRPCFTAMVCYVCFEHRSMAVMLAADVDDDSQITDEDKAQVWELLNEIELEFGH